jgi:hypothetical protein
MRGRESMMKVTSQGSSGAAMGSDVLATETATRVTPGTGPTFAEVMQGSAQSLVRGATAAVRVLPMSPVVAASVRTPVMSAEAGGVHASPVGVGWQVSAEAVGGGVGVSTGGGAAGPSVEDALQKSQEMNLYYLQLQEQMAAENRAYTAYSNVLKARHDTVKNAIGNIR